MLTTEKKFEDLNEFELIDEAEELYKLRVKENWAMGLLYPSKGIFPYRRPALAVSAKVHLMDANNTWEFFACIRSIDDAGVSIFGPPETYEKAKARFDKFITFIQEQEYKCPTPEELRAFCQLAGVGENYW